jgi:HEAT repeat protein
MVAGILSILIESAAAQSPAMIQNDARTLAEADLATRRAALNRLVTQGRAAVPAVTPLLRAPNPEVRRAALAFFAQTRTPEAFDAIISCISDNDVAVRATAVTALSQLGDRRAVRTLLASIDDTDQVIRMRAVSGLALLRAVEGVSAARNLLVRTDISAEERQAAILALGHLKASDAIPELVETARDLTESARTRAAAVLAIGEAADDIETLDVVQFLEDSSHIVRFNAVIVAAARNAAGAEGPIASMLRNRREQDYVRIRAAWALGEIGTPSALRVLFRVAREEPEFIAMHAARVLFIRNVPGSREAVAQLLARSGDQFVRSTLEGLLRQ